MAAKDIIILVVVLIFIQVKCCGVGGGFHHCSGSSGGGFCAYADITLAIKVNSMLCQSSVPVSFYTDVIVFTDVIVEM